jgi:hypothetical protein
MPESTRMTPFLHRSSPSALSFPLPQFFHPRRAIRVHYTVDIQQQTSPSMASATQLGTLLKSARAGSPSGWSPLLPAPLTTRWAPWTAEAWLPTSPTTSTASAAPSIPHQSIKMSSFTTYF